MSLDPDLTVLDVKKLYHTTKLNELMVKLNSQDSVGRIARHRLGKLQERWCCDVQPFQYIELPNYNAKNRDANTLWMGAAYNSARALKARVVTDDSRYDKMGRISLQHIIHSINSDDWTKLKVHLQRNGWEYLEQVAYWDAETGFWRMKDWGDVKGSDNVDLNGPGSGPDWT